MYKRKIKCLKPIMEYFHFVVLLFPREEYERDFQIFLTIMIKSIMDFFHFLFEIILFMVEKYKRYFQIFTTVIKPIMDLL